jgi:hypothetical protein
MTIAVGTPSSFLSIDHVQSAIQAARVAAIISIGIRGVSSSPQGRDAQNSSSAFMSSPKRDMNPVSPSGSSSCKLSCIQCVN